LPGNNKFKVLVACEVKAPLKLDPTPKVKKRKPAEASWSIMTCVDCLIDK
jgi:hypothetical protein